MKSFKVKLKAIWAIICNPTFYLYVSKGDNAKSLHHNLQVADAAEINEETKIMVDETVTEYHQEEFLNEVKNHLNGVN